MRSHSLAVLASISFLAVAAAGCIGSDEPTLATAASRAEKATAMLASPPGSEVVPTGVTRDFTLYLHPMPQHEMYPGSTMTMWGFSFSEDPATAQFPGPEIRVTEGDTVVITFRSLVAEFLHTLHWHGQHVPWDMDGVPYISQEPIQPGQEFVYRFIAKPAGTYWFHCHVDVAHHLDMGMYGALIVEPQNPADDPPFDREFTMFVDEMDKFHIEGGNPQTQNQPQSGDPYDWVKYAQRTSQDAVNRNQQVSDVHDATGTPARPTRDWYPVTFQPYEVDLNTFLINGHAFPYTPPVFIPDDGVLRIRLINAGDEVHAMHLHGHHMLVTHKDGILLDNPYWADTVLIAPGERYDLYVRGDNPGVWDFHDHIGSNNANDNIWPGGMMTLLVYDSFADRIGVHPGGHGKDLKHAGDLLRTTSGTYVRWYDHWVP